ncbi:MAG: hypothetical protein M0T85_15640 [Dehalococcoidales bacterium]|nr:hypothetical protein [Dehalococcoidales bacterium]
MTEFYRFFDASAGDRVYTSANMTEVLHRLLGNGVIRTAANALAVTVGAGVSVNVDTGEYMENGYWYKSDASHNIALATPDATNPRIDLIVVRLDLSAGVRSITVTNKSGVPAPSPTAPALEQDTTIWEESLAQVQVSAGSGTPLVITDERGWAGINPVPYLDAMLQSSTPSAPPTGNARLYPKADGKWYTETPAGTEATVGELWQHAQSSTAPDGVATQFNIGSGVASNKVRVFVNGLLRRPTTDYTFTSGNSYVTFAWVPQTGDDVRMDYVAV